MEGCNNNTMEMPMYFNFSKYLDNFLFEDLCINQAGTLIAALVVLIGLALLAELLKSVRAYLYKRTIANPLAQARSTNTAVNEHSTLLHSLRIPPTVGHIRRKRLKLHLGNSLLYLLEVIIGYLLMLSVMTYNAYILVAVICGFGIGYCLFGTPRESLGQQIVVPKTQHMNEENDHLDDQSLGRSYQSYESLER